MINPEINNRTTGFLILLLLILALHCLKPLLSYSGTRRGPCEGHLFIEIAGDIKFPGIYLFSQQANLKELIERAGGLSFETRISKSSKDITLPSGVKVIVQSDGKGNEISQLDMSAFYKFTLGIPLSLNVESEKGLTAIPGIGPELAGVIVRERSKRGGFKSLDEVMCINGIGNKLLIKIRPYLKL